MCDFGLDNPETLTVAYIFTDNYHVDIIDRDMWITVYIEFSL